jgi:hypothetical protein
VFKALVDRDFKGGDAIGKRFHLSDTSFATIVGGQTVLEETLVADGMEHQVTDAECRGTQRAEWSLDGRRLFAKADLTCADQKSRRISGLALIATDGTWLDVQSSWVDARESLRVRRYRRIADSVASLFVSAGRSFTLDAVKEAVGAAIRTVMDRNQAPDGHVRMAGAAWLVTAHRP